MNPCSIDAECNKCTCGWYTGNYCGWRKGQYLTGQCEANFVYKCSNANATASIITFCQFDTGCGDQAGNKEPGNPNVAAGLDRCNVLFQTTIS